MFGPEVAMDELAELIDLDPIELRVRNEPDVDPESGKPWSSRNLVACLREGARRFGWDADRRPGVRREGGVLVGTGVAASGYPVNRMPASTANLRYTGDSWIVDIGAADLGTGTWTRSRWTRCWPGCGSRNDRGRPNPCDGDPLELSAAGPCGLGHLEPCARRTRVRQSCRGGRLISRRERRQRS